MSVPRDSRVETKETEKRDKYVDLKIKQKRLWSIPVEVVLVVVGALGTIPRELRRNLEKIHCRSKPEVLQKSVPLATAHILRKVLDT